MLMIKVVKADFKGPKALAPLGVLDALLSEAQSVVDLVVRVRKFTEAEPHSLEDADKCIADLQALKPSEQDLTKLAIEIENGLRPAVPRLCSIWRNSPTRRWEISSAS
jgi:hypothetical protein